MDDEKLIEYIRGDIKSDREIIEILDWVDLSAEHQKRYNQLKNLWVLTGFEHIDAKIIPQFEPKGEKISHLTGRNFNQMVKYAAIFILAFLTVTLTSYYLIRKSISDDSKKYYEVYVPDGKKSVVTLYDGTKIWLNSGSTLRYPIVFDKHERKVFIVGEAYFDVAKKLNQPFIVITDQLIIKVLGTHFNISAYPYDPEIIATLEEGSIHATNSITGKGVILIPGEQAIYSRENRLMKCIHVQTELYTSWKEKRLQFENAEFEEVLKKLERWYGVTIVADKSINLKDRYTFTTKTESLSEILNLLSITNKMNYKIKEDTVFIKKSR